MFKREVLKSDFGEKNDCGVGINFNIGNIFKVALRWWECDYVIVLWVLMVEL